MNLRPLACQASALPLSYGPVEEVFDQTLGAVSTSLFYSCLPCRATEVSNLFISQRIASLFNAVISKRPTSTDQYSRPFGSFLSLGFSIFSPVNIQCKNDDAEDYHQRQHLLNHSNLSCPVIGCKASWVSGPIATAV